MKRLALVLCDSETPLRPPPGALMAEVQITDELLAGFDTSEGVILYTARQLGYSLVRLQQRGLEVGA